MPRVAIRTFTSSRFSRSNLTSSIFLFPRQFERVFDVLHHRFAPEPRNADDIESRVALLQSLLGNEILRRLNHLLLLSEFDGFERSPEAAARASLDFDEYQHAPIEDDQVELAKRATKITLDNLVTFFSEIRLCNALALFSQNLFGIVQAHASKSGP